MHQISYCTLFCALAADLPARGAALVLAYPENPVGPLLTHIRPGIDRILALTPGLLAGLPGLANASATQRILKLAPHATEWLSPRAHGISGQPPQLLRFRAIADVLGHLSTPRLLYLAPAPEQAALLAACRAVLCRRAILVWVDLPEGEDGAQALAVLAEAEEFEIFGLTATGRLRADPAPGEARVLLAVPRRGWEAAGLRALCRREQPLAEAAFPAQLILPAGRAPSTDLLRLLGQRPRPNLPAAPPEDCSLTADKGLYCPDAPLETGLIAFRARCLTLHFQPPQAGETLLRLRVAPPAAGAPPIALRGRIGGTELQFRWEAEAAQYHASPALRIEAAHLPLRLELIKGQRAGALLIRGLDLAQIAPLRLETPQAGTSQDGASQAAPLQLARLAPQTLAPQTLAPQALAPDPLPPEAQRPPRLASPAPGP